MVTQSVANMAKQIILTDRYDTAEVIKEEKEFWVISMLVLLGIEESDIDDENPDALRKYGIEVWDHLDNGDVEILQNNTLVAKWYAPMLIAKYDERRKIYYEVHLDYDSTFDNEFQSAEGEDDGMYNT